MSNTNFEAADSSLGFYFQSAYSLVLLADASDDAVVSVETIDDVKLADGGAQVLGQLKHSTGMPPALNEKNDGLWKTIGNWISISDWNKYKFMFVTCAELEGDCELKVLTARLGNRDVSKALNCLRTEAERVTATPTKAEAKGKKDDDGKNLKGFDFTVKRPACQAFLDLGETQQELLIRNLLLVTSSFNAGNVEAELIQRFLQAEPIRNRALIAERLIEWWDRRIARGLLRKSPREVPKAELLERLNAIRVELTAPHLPDDFGRAEPSDISSELGGNMQRQIELVDGGSPRVRRAARERWRARNQRDRWMDESLVYAHELDTYDEMLVEEWKDRHEVMAHDFANSEEDEQKKAGLELLDWSHEKSHYELRAFKDEIDLPFLVRGSFQQLADELRVGWHPDYLELCKETAVGKRWQDDDEH